MTELTESVAKTMKEFERLPGVGKKSAERIVYHLLKVSKEEALALSDAIRAMKENIRYCKRCFNLAEDDLCEICRDERRDASVLCVVEQPRDLIALEKTGMYRGQYHVLLGRLSPLDGVSPDQLTIEQLVKRVKTGAFKELIMATNPTVEGDGTALAITNRLQGVPIKITRLARGITTGSTLEFANNEMLADAISCRQSFNNPEKGAQEEKEE
ncbi:MAG: recombination protein RecR [Thermoguttaceae bacterium]|nr:recombination protein RecR [Thermoguttaceae bacterium]